MHNDLAKRIAANRREARREFLDSVQSLRRAYLENDRALCSMLQEVVGHARAAGHIDEPTTAAIIAPKDDPKP